MVHEGGRKKVCSWDVFSFSPRWGKIPPPLLKNTHTRQLEMYSCCLSSIPRKHCHCAYSILGPSNVSRKSPVLFGRTVLFTASLSVGMIRISVPNAASLLHIRIIPGKRKGWKRLELFNHPALGCCCRHRCFDCFESCLAEHSSRSPSRLPSCVYRIIKAALEDCDWQKQPIPPANHPQGFQGLEVGCDVIPTLPCGVTHATHASGG